MPEEITIQEIAPQQVARFRSVRLEALLESPSAFGSTYAKESQLTEADWRTRAIAFNGERRVLYLAMDEDRPCGIIGAYLDKEDCKVAQVISMWVAPACRRSGVGSALLRAIETWAEARLVNRLRLLVTNTNSGAICFYEHNGFAMTGNTAVHPNDPALSEYEMLRQLTP